MRYQDLAAALKKNGPAPVYVITGEEDYLRDQALAVIKAAVLGERDIAGFNYDLFDGGEAAAEAVACAAEVPAFAPRRLVVYKMADKISAREADSLLAYLEAPSESTTFVFVAPKLDKRLKLTQALNRLAVTVDCAPLQDALLATWIREEARRLGLRLQEEAVALLKDTAKESLYAARHELEKLAAYVPPGRPAGPADVEALRGGEPGASVFDLSSAIAAGARARALRILARNFEAGEAPVRILGSLVWQYRQIWKVQDQLRSGCSETQAARALGLPPYRLAGFAALARRLSEAHLRRAFAMFLQTDSRLKGGSGGSPEIVLESLVLALCATVDATRPTRETRPGPAAGAGAPRTVKPVRTWRTSGR